MVVNVIDKMMIKKWIPPHKSLSFYILCPERHLKELDVKKPKTILMIA